MYPSCKTLNEARNVESFKILVCVCVCVCVCVNISHVIDECRSPSAVLALVVKLAAC